MNVRASAVRTASVLALLASGSALAGVSPAEYTFTLAPGGSDSVDKTVTVPEVPPKLDVLLLIDLSGSYADDLCNLQTAAGAGSYCHYYGGYGNLAGQIWDDVCGGFAGDPADCRFAVASFVDFPFTPWGSGTDYAYTLHQDLSSSKADFVNAVDSLSTRSGYDYPESQYEGLYQAMTGAGRDINGDGDYDDLGEIAPGGDPAFAADATKVVIVTTDASFHEEGDTCSSYSWYTCNDAPYPDLGATGYPGASEIDTIDAAVDNGIKVVGLSAGGSTLSELDTLATATGGASLTTSTDSSDIADAIIDAIEALTFEVYGEADGTCDPFEVTFAPASHSDVPAGGVVTFTETVTAPLGTCPEDNLTCDVGFYADDTLIGTQALTVQVLDDSAPTVDCNADDTIIPPDAPISYTATASDECAVDVEITGYDCWTINGSGRRIDKTSSCVVSFDGDTITIEDSGGVGDNIEWTVVATDSSGNTTETTCSLTVENPGGGNGNGNGRGR